MKSAVFARPNLKLFLLGAILIAVVQNFIANGRSQATVLQARSPAGILKTEPDRDLQQLLAQAQSSPNSQLFTRISRCYEKQGDIKKALYYLRKAQILAQFEDVND